MSTQNSSDRRGASDYNNLTAVIFNQIRSGSADFERSTLMPWLSEAQAQIPRDRQRKALLDLAIKQMINDDIITQMPPDAPGANKGFTISSRCKNDELKKLETYTITNNTGYQWIKAVFKSRDLSQAMMSTLDDLEFYLSEETRLKNSNNVTSPSVGDGITPPTFQITGAATNGNAQPTDRPGDQRYRALSVGSDTTDGSKDLPDHTPMPPPAPPQFHGSPYKSSNPAHQSRRLDIGPKTSMGQGVSPPVFPMSSSIAGLKDPTGAQGPLRNDTPRAGIPDVGTPPIPSFLSSGLAALHEKYPDDEFSPSLEVNPGDLGPKTTNLPLIWLIKCHDCQDGIYRPSYTGANVGNFETHLKGKKHAANVFTKLEQLGRQPVITPDVRTRMDIFYQRSSASPQTVGKPQPQPISRISTVFPSILIERQRSTLSSRDEKRSSTSMDPTARATPVARSRSMTSESEPSLIVKLGPCEGLQKRLFQSTPSKDGGISKKRRLSDSYGDDTPLAKVQKKNAEAYARIEALELHSQSMSESFQERNNELDARFQDLTTFNLNLASSSEASKKKILELDRLVHARADVARMHDIEIENLKKSIVATLSTTTLEHDPLIKQVMSKTIEMEQTIKDLRELCAAQSKRLDVAAVVEKELKERITMVQRLALRQSEAMSAASKEKDETERRFARLERMIASQSEQNNDWTENFRTVIDRNTDGVMQCQRESEHIMERVEALEKDRYEKNAIVADLEAQINPNKPHPAGRTQVREGNER